MIKRCKDQFDSGGLRLEHIVFLPFDTIDNLTDSNRNIIKPELDKYLEEAADMLKSQLECWIMWKSGYEGTDKDGNWYKKEEK